MRRWQTSPGTGRGPKTRNQPPCTDVYSQELPRVLRMVSKLRSAEEYRHLAAVVREQAEAAFTAREALMQIASDYEHLAQALERIKLSKYIIDAADKLSKLPGLRLIT